MNLKQAAYEILVMLLVCDGEYDDNEGRTIREFLEDNHDGSFDPHASNLVIQELDGPGLDALMRERAAFVKAGSTVDDRVAILEFGVDLIMGDDELSEDENRLVRELADTWEVPLQPIATRVLSGG